ncbi:MAG: hypothetical protein IBX72_11875 [Nitrospirae bacterium]|nr:hypothetical protein [Nitrospirota bacterium]
MKKSKTLIITLPLMVILFGLIMYNYVYLRIQTDIASLKEEQSIKAKTLEKYINVISEKPEVEKKLASLKELRKAEDSKLVEGQTLSLAAASLQEKVKETVTRSGGTISSERVGKPEDAGNFRAISVSIDTVMPDPTALRDILYSLETRTPYLTIKDLDVRVRNFRDPKEVVVKLDVTALTSSR